MNIELFEGQSCLVHVKLPEEWKVYGGTPKGEFRSERESADSVLVTVPAMEAEFTPLVPYELFARRILDGKEWLVLSGQLHVRRRYSDAGGGVSAIEYFVEPKLVEDGISSSPQIIVGIPGPQGPKGDKGDPGEGGVTAEERALLNGAAQRDADNTFTAANTFTGSVDMSTAQVTPPEGWNVGELTAEAIQAVAPMAWDDKSVIYGTNARKGTDYNTAVGADSIAGGSYATSVGRGAGTSTCGVSVGASASSQAEGASVGYATEANWRGVSIGYSARNNNSYCIAVGYKTKNDKANAITLGAEFTETVNEENVTNYCQTQGTGSITIGAGANTLNNGDTESSNSVTIGCKAENKGADSVVIGAGAKGTAAGSLIIGAGANANGSINNGWDCMTVLGTDGKASGRASTVVGYNSSATFNSTALGSNARSSGNSISVGYASGNTIGLNTCSIGAGSQANGNNSIALGFAAKVNDIGATVIRSTASDGTYTQLYFSGANTPLANTYHGGAPMLGYVTKDSAGNIVAAGTRSLIDLLTDNSTFAPASLDENGEWVMPKVFHPSDLDMPVEEPSEPEEYQPLPVYPIVEPDDIMGDNGTLEQGDTENTSPETNA